MNEQAYRELPRHIRERFSAIADSNFDGHPKVVAARKRVEQAEAGHRLACEKAHQLRTRREQVEVFGETCRTKAREFHEHRIQNLADVLAVQGTDVLVTVDTEVRDTIEQFDAIAEAVPVAIRQMDRQLVELNRRTHAAARDTETAEENLRGVLDALRLEKARQQAS